jgi:hypothetical protein
LWHGILLWKLSEYLSQGEPVPTLVPSPFCSSVSITGEFSPNFDLKIMISSYTKDFSWEKNGPTLPDFEFKKFQIARVL